MSKVLIVGATSAIAEAVARRYAARGAALYLVARNAQRLEAIEQDLRVRGATNVVLEILDANQHERHAGLCERAAEALGGLDIALIAHGSLPDQKATERSADVALAEFGTNALSVISLLTHLANWFEARGAGTIAVISSVAGDRGRASNYVYGAAKAAVTAFTDGLRNRLFRSGVHVLTIKPGFVDTPMTARFSKGPLWATPAKVARDIDRAIDRRTNVLYTPGFWRLIMFVVRAIPEAIFKRAKL